MTYRLLVIALLIAAAWPVLARKECPQAAMDIRVHYIALNHIKPIATLLNGDTLTDDLIGDLIDIREDAYRTTQLIDRVCAEMVDIFHLDRELTDLGLLIGLSAQFDFEDVLKPALRRFASNAHRLYAFASD